MSAQAPLATEIPGIAQEATDTAVEGFDLRQIVAVVRTYLMWIIGIMVAAIVFGVVWTMLQTPLYTANTTVQIDDAAAQILQNGQDVQAQSASFDVDRFLNTQLDVLKSRALAKRVADRLKLYGNPQFRRAVGVSDVGPTDRKALEENTIMLVRSRMSVTLPRQTRVATIAVTTADPQMSADMANAYAEEFIRANLQRKFESSDYARQFVAQQLETAKQRLETAERDLNAYARSAGLIRARSVDSDGQSTGGEASVTTSSLMQLNSAANSAHAARIQAEAKWRSVSGEAALNSQQVLSNSSVQSLLVKRTEVEANLREERSRHLDEHPNVIKLQAQLDVINQQLNAVIAGVRNSVRQEYQTALAAEQEINSKVERLKSETLNEQDLSVRYAILAREADTSRTLYDGLLQRYKELTAAAGIASSNISLIDRASVPRGASSPNLVVNLAYAIFVGLVITATLLFVRLQLDDAVRVPEDVEHKLSLPVLGIIPKLFNRDPFEQLADPKSSLSEAYNSLRGSIGFSTPNGAPHLLLVTSASASEGKSTTSLALARGFAKLGRKVLLVDVDMRRPSTHRQFQVDNEFGLSTVLVGQTTLGDSIRTTEFENLSILTSGPIPPSPTELLASPRMLALLEDARARYDIVVLDSPPILGLADAPLMSSLVDGTLLVLESDRNRRGVLKGTLRRLRLARGRVIGVALTKFDATHASSYTYYYGYGYDYYAYDGGEHRGKRSAVLDKLRSKLPGREREEA